jgi:hypothetical protein
VPDTLVEGATVTPPAVPPAAPVPPLDIVPDVLPVAPLDTVPEVPLVAPGVVVTVSSWVVQADSTRIALLAKRAAVRVDFCIRLPPRCGSSGSAATEWAQVTVPHGL